MLSTTKTKAAAGALVLALAAVSSRAQESPPPVPPAPAPHRDPLAGPLAAAKKALAEGKKSEAAEHLRRGLAVAPDSIEVLALLVDACDGEGGDADAHRFWQHALAVAATAPGGALALDNETKKRLSPDDPWPAAIAAARAAAVEELLKLATAREKEGAAKSDSLLVAQWARRTALDLAQRSPALLAAHASELSPRLTLSDSLPARVVKSLETFGSSALGNGRTADAIKTGRILAGLGVESGWDKDLQGPKPAGVSGLKAKASDLLARARQQLGSKIEKPWTVDELLQLDGDQAEAFTRAHDTFANPGIAVSPKAWYRIETDCGHETLLGAANTVEQHHQRLATWYGQDPFVGHPGLLRVVPEATGLESEGVPFWWAAGFQSGDITTVRFSCSTIEGLGHLLTHELTHRFDGAIYPGLPAWLMEGKAVWTGGSYGAAADERFVENCGSLGTIEGALIKGYADANNLTKLIEGTIDDYRDNYVAGYALYVYLTTRKSPGGRVLFKERLQKFQTGARGVKKWKEHFVACFCDGHDERPKDFAGFVADWAPWLAGFYWQSRTKSPWTRDYVDGVAGPADKTVMDEPTWVWSRHRAEPRFGQDQAALAGNLLLDAGKRSDAIPALVWALAVDGRRPQEESRLATALEEEGRKDAAWCLRDLVEFPYGARAGAAPFAGTIGKARALIDALDGASNDAAAKGFVRTAAALHVDRERLASWLGVERAESSKSVAPIDVAAPTLAFDGGARPLAPNGWTESGLTDYEERRAKGRWYVDDAGNLVVGRDKPRAATGTVDRASAQIHCFALAPEWVLPGTWRLDCRVRFTTSFVNGAVIFGYTEREANLRFSFSAGDFLYAVGVSDKEPEFKDMGWSLDGLRDRDGGLSGSTSGGGFGFGSQQSSFELTLLVDGAFVKAFINGTPVGRYHTVDGAAIEGQIGFATSMGAIQVEQARVTRLERSRIAPSKSFEPTCFDLFSPISLPPWNCDQRSCVGLPKLPQGTLLLWLAPPDKKPADDAERAALLQRLQWDVREFATFVERTQPTQRLLVAAPAALDEASRAAVTASAKKLLGERADVLFHEQPFVPDGIEAPPSRRWLFFVDSAGIVRARSDFPNALIVADPASGFTQWLTVFRDHGRPPRDLPPVERPQLDPAGNPKDDGGK